MKNKNGFLLAEETLKIIIAVICLGFLAYFLVSIYMNSKTEEKLELAKASLGYLVEEINARHDNVEIYNPKGWVIVSWAKGNMPNSCSNLGWENCLCICENVGFFKKGFNFIKKIFVKKDDLERFIKKCDNTGYCLQDSSKVDGLIKIDPPLRLKIDGDTIIKNEP